MKYIKYFEELSHRVLIMENETEVDKDFYNEIWHLTGIKPDIITAVAYKMRDEVGIAINNADTIAFQSLFTSTEQIDKFMKLFSMLPHKKVIIKMRRKDMIKLESNPLFETNKLRHEIIFIYEDEVS